MKDIEYISFPLSLSLFFVGLKSAYRSPCWSVRRELMIEEPSLVLVYVI